MSKLVNKSKNWIPIADFLKHPLVNMTMSQLYNKVRRRIWRNGYVIKKGNDTNQWEYGCLEDFKECKGI